MSDIEIRIALIGALVCALLPLRLRRDEDRIDRLVAMMCWGVMIAWAIAAAFKGKCAC